MYCIREKYRLLVLLYFFYAEVGRKGGPALMLVIF